MSAAQVAAVLLNICGMAIVALSDEDHSAVASASKAGVIAHTRADHVRIANVVCVLCGCAGGLYELFSCAYVCMYVYG